MFEKLNAYQLYLKYKYTLPFLKSLENCEEIQKKLLFQIIRKNKNTLYGKDNNFNRIKTINDFKNLLPIIDFENLNYYIQKTIKGEKDILIKDKIHYFAITSGTTSEPKFLPHTKNYIEKRKRAWNIWIERLYTEKPRTFSVFGKILTITAKPFDGVTQSGIIYGSVSGQIHDMQLELIRITYAVPDEVFLIDDFKLKYYICILFTLKSNLSLIVTPNPSTLILVAKEYEKHYYQLVSDFALNQISSLENNKNVPESLKKKILKKFTSKAKNKKIAYKLKKIKYEHKKILPKHIFKNLQTIGCWTGGNVGIYTKELNKYYGENVLIREIGYMASEGRFTIPIKTTKCGEGILDINTNFYEFVEVENYYDDENSKEHNKKKKTYLANELELNKQYYLIITNENGLYRYFMDDIVYIHGFEKKTPIISFIQKGKYTSSITGEKITEWEIMKIMDNLNKNLKISFSTFFVLPIIENKNPHYEFNVRFEKKLSKDEVIEYEKYLDIELQKLNIEYEEKRKSKRLSKIKIVELQKGSLNKLKKAFTHGKNDTQVKVPKLITLEKDRKIIEELNLKLKLKI